MSRNLEAPGFMKDFEEVLNQVQNLIPPMDYYHYLSITAVVAHYSLRLLACNSGKAADEKEMVRVTSSVLGNKLGVCLSTPNAYVFNNIRGGTREMVDFEELRSFIEPRFSNEECVICCQETGFNQLMWRLPCAHEMHYYCCIQWMKRSRTFSCPLCRMVVTMEESGWECKGGVFVVRSQPIMASILNYISYEDLKRWRHEYRNTKEKWCSVE